MFFFIRIQLLLNSFGILAVFGKVLDFLRKIFFKNLEFLILFGLANNVNDKSAYYEYNLSCLLSLHL